MADEEELPAEEELDDDAQPWAKTSSGDADNLTDDDS